MLNPHYAGARAEAAVFEAVDGLGHVPDRVAPHYDAVAVDPVAEIPGVRVLPRGTRVEIKSAMVVRASGRRGRFQFRRGQHAALLDVEGVYLFVICTPTPAREIIAMRTVHAAEVDDRLGTWTARAAARPDSARLSWSRLFDVDAVEDG